jgi:hypothetical protein
LMLAVPVVQEKPQPTHEDLMKAIIELQKETAETKELVRVSNKERQAQRELRARETQAERERQRLAALAKKKQSQQLERQRQRVSVAEQRLNATRIKLEAARRNALIEQNIDRRLAELDARGIPKGQTEQEQRLLLSALVVERARLREKIKKNNRTIRCRIFHVGCVKVNGR